MEVEQSSQFADFSANGAKPASDLNHSPQIPDDPSTSTEQNSENSQPPPADPVTVVPPSRPAGMPVLQQHGKVGLSVSQLRNKSLITKLYLSTFFTLEFPGLHWTGSQERGPGAGIGVVGTTPI